MRDWLLLGLGVACAGAGGELFVRGAVGVARWVRISPGIIGATVVAFATSAPELSVAIGAGLAGEPQIALGDALGSNVVNVALILALALVVSAIRCPRDAVARDFPVALAVPPLTAGFILDGVLSRTEATLLLIGFTVWLLASLREALRQRSTMQAVPGEARAWPAMTAGTAGLVLLIFGARLIVAGATGVALAAGLDAFVVGATLVAIGTSVPELATAIVSKLRGHDEIGLGAILGSNVFNGLFIVPVAALISPIAVAANEVMVALGIGWVAVMLTFPRRDGVIGRGRGVWLLVLYAAYLFMVLRVGG